MNEVITAEPGELVELEPALLQQIQGGECPVFQDLLKKIQDFFS